MGELSEQTRLLLEEWVEIKDRLGADSYDGIEPAYRDRLDLAANQTRLLLARSEGPSPGYDGGKSLGERLYAACDTAGLTNGLSWSRVHPVEQAQYDRAAVTFTASLSGGEGGLGAIPEPARLDLNGPPDGDEFLEFKETLSDLRSLRAEHRDLNGGGPGWMTRWLNAWVKADELFANEDEAAWVRQQEDAHG